MSRAKELLTQLRTQHGHRMVTQPGPTASLYVAEVIDAAVSDYEAAVEALEDLVASDDEMKERSGLRYVHEGVQVTHISESALDKARAALRRLRDEVTA